MEPGKIHTLYHMGHLFETTILLLSDVHNSSETENHLRDRQINRYLGFVVS